MCSCSESHCRFSYPGLISGNDQKQMCGGKVLEVGWVEGGPFTSIAMMTLARANLGISWVGSSSWNDVFCSKPLSVFELFCTYRLCQGLHETLILLLILSLLSHNCIGCPRVFWMMRIGNIHSFPFIYSHHFRHYRSASFLPHLLPVISRLELSVIISLVSVVTGALYTGVVQGLQGRCSLGRLGMSCSLSCAK